MDQYRYFIVLFLSLLISSCGQVGRITGGPVDNEAPKPIENEITPPNASLNIAPQNIEIPFNEYITLNKPSENIKVSPDDVSLEYSIKGKSLLMEVSEGEWQQNTTYSIYLNRAVEDITESNDSIMLYVFSTGQFIDSLQGAVKIESAYDGKAKSNITVGLYEEEINSDTTDQKPKYFSVTDDQGVARFKYLKSGEYYVYAFDDENKNNILDPIEDRGKLLKKFVPVNTDSLVGSIEIMPPSPTELIVRTNEFISPGVWCLGFNMSVTEEYEVALLSEGFIDSTWNETMDSLTFFLENSQSGSASIILSGQNQKDTVVKRFFFKDPVTLTTTSDLRENNLIFGRPLVLKANDAISAIDASKITLHYIEDSSKIDGKPELKIQNTNEIVIKNLDRTKNKVELKLHPESLIGENLVQKDTILLSFNLGKEEDLGTLILTLDTIPENGLLFLQNGKGQVVNKKVIESKNIRFEYLTPGRYKYYILIDDNNNGVWDTGDIFTNKQPENILWLNQSSTVRSNWEVESKLNLKSTLE
tara:strand:- start:164510 stop:166102 length:1593 start_codon:yes stop_codon:yes gene_type:complete